MNQKVNIPVSVVFSSDPFGHKIIPVNVSWNGRDFAVTRVGLHHTFRSGKTLFHIFSVIASGTFFRLSFNTDNLLWRLEEISDGLPG